MSMGAAPPVRRRRDLLIVLIVSTIVGALVLVTSVPFVLMSFMVFDAGETTEAWIAFAAIWSLPMVLILGVIIAWIAFAARAYRGVYAGLVIAALPFAAVVLLLLVVASGAGI